MEIKAVDKSEIHIIKPLWEKLNEIHQEDSIHFKDHFANFTFEKRCKDLVAKNSEDIQINVLYDEERPVGYCISTVKGNRGEIESLFIEKQYRKLGYGDDLVERGISWLKSNNCERIEVSVASGHESVFGFYKKFGFYPSMTTLRLKEETR
ncbi:MAG: GNAT family N-acetyltransferase [Spirochaetales bacterium]|nr:GNAT family N-acetyltransferase [Spirochaetales bacterium]